MIRKDDPAPANRVSTRLELPWSTIARVILTIVIIALLARLWKTFLLVFVAMLLAAALDPAVRWVQRRGLNRPAAVGVVFVCLIAGIVLVLWLLIPPLIDEAQAFANDLPGYVDRGERILEKNPDVYERVRNAAESASADPSSVLGGFLSIGSGLITGITNALLMMVMTIYFLVDGGRIYAWNVRYLPATQKERLDRAIPEVSAVVSGYVAGQLITSALFGIFTFTLLTLVGVPQALFLAIVAAFADAIPIAGVLIATIPATLLALTVSVPAAIVVLVSYLVYQQVENYVIAPRIYKNTLQISSFAVLIAVLIGGELLGIVGVMLALPIAAAIPVIERIWLAPGIARAEREAGEQPVSLEAPG